MSSKTEFEQPLASNPHNDAWLRYDVKPEFVARKASNINRGDWKIAWHGTPLAVAIRSVDEGLKTGPGETQNNERV